LSPDDALASVRAATVVVAPHAAKTQLPFLRSSRRGSGVVVSLDGAGGDLRVLTAAHVACLAGPDNRVDVCASDAANAPTRVGSVVAVHPRLDLALIALDDVAPSVSDIATLRKRDAPDDGKEKDVFPSTFAPLAAAPPPVGARVAALGYAMGWSSAFRTAMRRRDDAAAGVWGELLATHAECFRDEDDERFSGTDRDDETDEKMRVAAFALHTASVASGCSGGPLVSERGEVIGVHSFGDAFYGGARDVAVATPRDLVQRLGAFGTENETPRAKPASPETYATATVLASVFASSDPALAAMCPELTPERRKAWIL
jgi:S1-C subfamily serine protease